MSLTKIKSSNIVATGVTPGSYTASNITVNTVGQLVEASSGQLVQGIQGLQGIIGPQGIQGITGIQGASGYLGQDGIQGIQGIQGGTGLAFTIAKVYNSVAALTSDTAPTGIVSGQFAIIDTTDPNNADNSKLYLWNGSSYQYVNDLSGTAGIQGISGSSGAQGPSGGFSTNSDAQVNSLGVGVAASTTAGEIRASGNITAYYSDERLKKYLGKIENALEKVKQLEGFYYEPNELAQSLGYSKVKREVGLGANKTKEVLPEVVTEAPIDPKYLTLYYERLIPLLVEAIKELSDIVDNKNKKL